MRLDMLLDFKTNELESFAMVSMLLSLSLLIIGALFDPLAKKFGITHQSGFGLGQIIWCAFWGVYSFWAYTIASKWGE